MKWNLRTNILVGLWSSCRLEQSYKPLQGINRQDDNNIICDQQLIKISWKWQNNHQLLNTTNKNEAISWATPLYNVCYPDYPIFLSLFFYLSNFCPQSKKIIYRYFQISFVINTKLVYFHKYYFTFCNYKCIF